MWEFNNVLEELSIPIISTNTRFWLVRTNGGDYYNDFIKFGFISIGWNNVSKNMVVSKSKQNRDRIVDEIARIYPNQGRPGLIYNQVHTFYYKIQEGDYIIIPSEGSERLALGKVKDNVIHEGVDAYVSENAEYFAHRKNEETPYQRRRSISWEKSIPSSCDIYITKMLRAHQTISNVSDSKDIILRNAYGFYADNSSVSLSLYIKADNGLSVSDMQLFLSSLTSLGNTVCAVMGEETNKYELSTKMAFNSPGILELILSGGLAIPVALILYHIIVGGKIKIGPFESETEGIIKFIKGLRELKYSTQDHEFATKQQILDLEIQQLNNKRLEIENLASIENLDMVKVKHNLSLLKELDEAKRQLDESKKILHLDNVEHSEPVVTPKRCSRK